MNPDDDSPAGSFSELDVEDVEEPGKEEAKEKEPTPMEILVEDVPEDDDFFEGGPSSNYCLWCVVHAFPVEKHQERMLRHLSSCHDDLETVHDAEKKPYPLGQVIGTVLLSVVAIIIPLCFPMARADAGFAANWSFLWIYNSWTGWSWAGHSYERLRLVFPDARPPFGLSWTVWKLIGGMGFPLSYNAVCAIWGTRLQVSYVMVYTAPVAFVVVDLLFVFCLVSDRLRDEFIYIVKHNAICSLPMGIVIAFVVIEGLVDSVWVQIAVPIANLLVTEVAVTLAEATCCFEFRRLGNPTLPYITSGYNLLLEVIFVFSELLIIASNRHLVTPIMIIVVDTIPHIQFVRDLNKFLAVVRQREKPHWTVANALWMRQEAHVAQVVGPLLFTAVLPVLLFRGNRRKYYLYECGRKGVIPWSYIQVAIKLAWTFTLVTRELLLLRKCNLWPLVKASHIRIFDGGVQRTGFTFAFAGVVFTSCWLIYHDGIRILRSLSNCEPIQPVNTLFTL